MPQYPYIRDGDTLSATDLNTKFTAVAGEINAVGPQDIRLHGLGPANTPSFVGSAFGDGQFTAETGETYVDTPDHAGSPPVVPIPADAWYTISADGYELKTRSLSSGTVLLTRDSTSDVNAMVLLGNVEVKQFYTPDIDIVNTDVGGADPNRWGINLNEYEWEATVAFELEDSNGTTAIVHRSQRHTSPRVTVSYVGNYETPDPPTDMGSGYLEGRLAMTPMRDLPGGSPPDVTQFDHKTYQDVPLMCVITSDDLDDLGLDDVKYVRFAFASYNARKYQVQRANLTAIPLLAGLD